MTLRRSLFVFALLALSILGSWWWFGRSEYQVSLCYYHWKSEFDPDSSDWKNHAQLGSSNLALHLFDLDWAASQSAPELKSRLRFKQSLPDAIAITPVVYITQRFLKNCPVSQRAEIATGLVEAMEKVSGMQRSRWKAVQWDCDWTESTRDAYFDLLKHLKTEIPNIQHSVTLRLHQLKYLVRSGIPPADRAVLMLYNVGEFRTYDAENSLYSRKAIAPYLRSIQRYPLPLDLALPLFSWGLHYRYGKVQGVFAEPELEAVQSDSLWFHRNSKLHVARKAFFCQGRYIMKGDVLKIEEAGLNEARDAVEALREHWKTPTFTLYFYHWNSPVARKHGPKPLLELATHFQ